MGLIELLSLGISSIIMVVLSKTRMHCKSSCSSCSYNEHNIDLADLTSAGEEKADCVSDDELHMDSFATLPPPPAPVFRSAQKIPLPVNHNLRNLK